MVACSVKSGLENNVPNHASFLSQIVKMKMYRMGLVVVDLGWVNLDFNVPPSCRPTQPIEPNSHLLKHNKAGGGMTQIEVNQTTSPTL